ncbi:MAG: SH3 domain-containing protein [Deltaproteobacteria bacterium]|nr:SH3 domain-containing protein [Deltaproteobacteria bacterium]MBW2660000.1 SH3 domain-containing protein [Deltaproteobacteria bacterium]
MNIIAGLNKRRCVILAIGMALLFFSANAFAAEYVSVKKDGVNVRTGPGTDKPVSMELFAGYPLKVIKKQGDWYKVSDFENDTGWIYKSLITKGDTVIINAKKSVNMRSGPSTKSSIVADVERGVVLTKISRKGKWTQVRHSSGTVGWVYNPLIWP